MSLIIETELRALHESSKAAQDIIQVKGQYWGNRSSAVWKRQTYKTVLPGASGLEIPSASLFEQVKDSEDNQIPSITDCASHLKLLESFYVLKQAVFKSKELDKVFNSVETPRVVRRRGKDVKIKDSQFKAKREKKWPRFVEYAVSRFLIWWEKIDAVLEKNPDGMSEDNLPPLDVLMVWHSFLLNPQLYIDHCKKHNRWSLYKVPFPWNAIHQAISIEDWSYTPTVTATKSFESLTNHPSDLYKYLTRLPSKPATAFQTISRHTDAQSTLPSSTPTLNYSNMTAKDLAFISITHGVNPPLHPLLTAAIHRQASFISKMDQKLWLRSPSISFTLTTARTRYNQFLSLFKLHPGTMLVPALEIDLVWHTHQLSAFSYKQDVKELAGRFLDHDDKIAQGSLDSGLEVTKGLWKVRFGEEFEKCTCWECEAILEKVDKCVEEGREFSQKDAKDVAGVVAYYKEVEEARRKRRALPVMPVTFG